MNLLPAYCSRHVSAVFVALALALSARDAAASGFPADFDHDGKTDLTVYRPSTGEWYVRQSSTGFSTYSITQWGLPGDVAVAGDYDGDGQSDYAVYRRIVPWSHPGQVSEWYLLLSSTGYSAYTLVRFGLATDIPVPADYDGDGKTDIAVFRPSDGTWHVRRSGVTGSGAYIIYSNAAGSPFSSDYPVPADYDGDGKIDLAVYRRTTATWYFRLSSTGFGAMTSTPFGTAADRPVQGGDYDGDGKADLALYRPSDSTWTIRPSSGGAPMAVTWGMLGDTPVPGDYDGDGKLDIAVHRPSDGVWYVLEWAVAYQWAIPGDLPVPGSIQRDALRRVHAYNDSIRASDFDGDARADLTVFRPSDGTWYTLRSSTDFATSTTVSWGLDGDVPVPGDVDGDGIADIRVWRPSDQNWFFKTLPRIYYQSFNFQNPERFGLAGDIPLSFWIVEEGVTAPMAVYRPPSPFNPGWNFKTFRGVSIFCSPGVCTAGAGAQPVAADYDGDGRPDLAVYMASTGTWKIASTVTRTELTFQLGAPGDIPVPLDYDGDGAADLAVFRPSTGNWSIRLSSTGYVATQTYTWGANGDIPVPGDYDGDGSADVAVWRASTGVWSILKSSTNFTQGVAYQWGLPGDVPILGRQ